MVDAAAGDGHQSYLSLTFLPKNSPLINGHDRKISCIPIHAFFYSLIPFSQLLRDTVLFFYWRSFLYTHSIYHIHLFNHLTLCYSFYVTKPPNGVTLDLSTTPHCLNPTCHTKFIIQTFIVFTFYSQYSLGTSPVAHFNNFGLRPFFVFQVILTSNFECQKNYFITHAFL